MTQARKVTPGDLVFITRRCLERRFFLHPDPQMNHLFRYLLAVGCERYELRPAAVCQMSSHYHLVVEDPQGQHPRFTQWFHSLLARAGNFLRGRTDAFWSAAQCNVVELVTPFAAIDKIAYTLGNPVKDGLVEHGRDWPGVRSTPEVFRQAPEVITRPEFFFAEDTELPDEVELRFHIPEYFAELRDEPERFCRRIADAVAAEEARHRERIRNDPKRHGFLGVRGVMKHTWRDSAKTPERHGPEHVTRPHVAAQNQPAMQKALFALKRFRREYDDALEAWRDGDRDVRFPAGTWKMRVLHSVRCHDHHCHGPP